MATSWTKITREISPWASKRFQTTLTLHSPSLLQHTTKRRKCISLKVWIHIEITRTIRSFLLIFFTFYFVPINQVSENGLCCGFTGDRYYQYEFKHQPSHGDCVRMTKASPAVLFTRYANLYCDYNWDDLFSSLFQDCETQPTLVFIYTLSQTLLTYLLPLVSCPVISARIRTSQRATLHFQRLGGHQTSDKRCDGGPAVPELQTCFTCIYTFTFCSSRQT